jgi:hypothetical protein
VTLRIAGPAPAIPALNENRIFGDSGLPDRRFHRSWCETAHAKQKGTLALKESVDLFNAQRRNGRGIFAARKPDLNTAKAITRDVLSGARWTQYAEFLQRGPAGHRPSSIRDITEKVPGPESRSA